MSWWGALADSFGSLLVVACLFLAFLFARRRWLSRAGGTFECSVRFARPPRPGAVPSSEGWTLGLARYADDDLEWFRVFSLSPWPRHVFSRSMHVVGRRTPLRGEAFSLHAGHVVTDIALVDDSTVELAMSEGALTGFLAWSEAAPPGADRLLA